MERQDRPGYFATQQELADVSKTDGAGGYVILQNDALHSRVERLERRVREAERERDRASAEADRRDRSATCMKGLLHNQVEEAACARRLCDALDAGGRGALRAMASASMVSFVAAAILAAPPFPAARAAAVAMQACATTATVFIWLRGEPTAVAERRAELSATGRASAGLHELIDEL